MIDRNGNACPYPSSVVPIRYAVTFADASTAVAWPGIYGPTRAELETWIAERATDEYRRQGVPLTDGQAYAAAKRYARAQLGLAEAYGSTELFAWPTDVSATLEAWQTPTTDAQAEALAAWQAERAADLAAEAEADRIADAAARREAERAADAVDRRASYGVDTDTEADAAEAELAAAAGWEAELIGTDGHAAADDRSEAELAADWQAERASRNAYAAAAAWDDRGSDRHPFAPMAGGVCRVCDGPASSPMHTADGYRAANAASMAEGIRTAARQLTDRADRAELARGLDQAELALVMLAEADAVSAGVSAAIGARYAEADAWRRMIGANAARRYTLAVWGATATDEASALCRAAAAEASRAARQLAAILAGGAR
jgi:hypothetical protein